MRVPVLYRDDDIVVVDKPAGLPTHAADASDPYPGDALRVAQGQLNLPYLGMHQRLDAETSGVLLFSARPEANKALAATFEGREVHKVYAALVHRQLLRPEGTIDVPLVRERDGRYRATSPSDARGQPARTRYRLLEGRARYSLVELVPETGRTHQIRVHLAHLGHPVVGDRLYGPPADLTPRLCLHARELALPHPASGREVRFSAPLPPIFERLAIGLPEVALAASALHVREAVRREPGALRALLELARERRGPLAVDPNTTIYRLVNAAGDGIPGLIVDRYGRAIIASLYDEDEGSPLSRIPAALVEMLAAVFRPETIHVKYRRRQAARLTDELSAALAPAEPIFVASERAEDVVAGGPGEQVAVEEDLTYAIRPGEGLSVGLFPDMRETRARVRVWAAGRTVLNCFAYTCGFGVAANQGGARRVLNLDLSKPVLAWGQENYRLNSFAPDPYDFVFGDVFDWLARFARRGEMFDLVILDPPGFARTKTRRFSAAQDYAELVTVAARVTSPGGRVLACSNVAELPWRAFRKRVLEGARAAGRRPEIAAVYHEPSIDFPAVSENYLKVALVQLD